MLRMDWLETQMNHCDTMAQWLYRQFSYEFAGQSLEDWQHEFCAGQHDGNWKCLIATEHDRLLGGATLAAADLSERPELGPWLACVLIAPEAPVRGPRSLEMLLHGLRKAFVPVNTLFDEITAPTRKMAT